LRDNAQLKVIYLVLKNLVLWAKSKSPALPWSFVSKITNSKHQKTNKLQTTSTKFQRNSKLQAPNLKEIPKFVILNFGYCDLFVI